jgi:Sap, sulfolipid-1-addressing protein
VSLVTLLPLAFVMIAGPQVITSVFLATTEQWKRNSLAFLLGAAIAISLVVTGAYVLGRGAKSAGASNKAIYVVVLVLLLAAMVNTYRKRKQTEPPKWMGRLATADPKLAFKLGFLLLGLFPSDFLTSLAVGSYLSAHHDPLWRGAPFLGLTLLLLGLPALILLGFGSRAQAFLPKARQWMLTNAWIVNEIVLTLFVVIVIDDLAG